MNPKVKFDIFGGELFIRAFTLSKQIIENSNYSSVIQVTALTLSQP